MVIRYLDTSAAMKLIVDEAESAALAEYLVSAPEDSLVASWLLFTELHCAASTNSSSLPIEAVSAVLDAVALVDLRRADLISAAAISGLRLQDAIHLACAIRLQVDRVITYDQEMASAAERLGLRAESPR